MSLEVFISCSEAKQVTELKKFLKQHGAKSLDSIECQDETWPDDFYKCIEQLNVCWKDDSVSDKDTNDVLSTVASLFIQLPPNKSDITIHLLCEKFLDFSGENIKKHKAKLLPLTLLFCGLAPSSHFRYDVYLTLVECSEKLGTLDQVITDPKKVLNWLNECECTVEECQKVWRKLYNTHSALGENRCAIEALIYLLSTYTDATAVQARQEAIKCIILVLQDPSLLSHDQLYALVPVQFLEGEPVHDSFLNTHQNFLSNNNLDKDACLHKLRLLSLMQLSENLSEITYDAAASKLNLDINEVEPFIIEAVRQRSIACKLDQVQRKILITGAFPRTFGRPQWVNLRETLQQWQSRLKAVQLNLAMMVQTNGVDVK